MQSLKAVLEKVADGKTYEISKSWPLQDGNTVWSANLTEPTGAALLEQSGVLHGEQGRDGRALHGALHSTGLGALPQQDRALHGAASGALVDTPQICACHPLAGRNRKRVGSGLI